MRAFKLMSVISIVFALGGYLFPSNYAYAGCCSPCTCYGWCWCMGVNNCPRYACDKDDSASLQIQALNNNEKLDVSGFYDSSRSSDYRSPSVNRLKMLSDSRQCAQNSFAKSLFRNPESQLKFERAFFDYKLSNETPALASMILISE